MARKGGPDQIAVSIGVSIATVYRLLKRIREGELVRENRAVLSATARGRTRVFNSRTYEVVREVLTSDPTMTLERTLEELRRRGVDMSASMIWRIATKLRQGKKKTATKPAAVFDDRVTNQRLNYAQRVNQLPDQELWFLDESGFNLHIAPLRCWAPKGRTPTLAVPTNRGVNVSLLMCISSEASSTTRSKQVVQSPRLC